MQEKAAADRDVTSRNIVSDLCVVHTAVARSTSAEVCEDMYEVMFPGAMHRANPVAGGMPRSDPMCRKM